MAGRRTGFLFPIAARSALARRMRAPLVYA